MKITITMHGKTYGVESDSDHGDIQEVIEMIRGLLVSCGYHPETVDKNLSCESQWFQETHDDDNEEIVSQTEPYHHPFLTRQIK